MTTTSTRHDVCIELNGDFAWLQFDTSTLSTMVESCNSKLEQMQGAVIGSLLTSQKLALAYILAAQMPTATEKDATRIQSHLLRAPAHCCVETTPMIDLKSNSRWQKTLPLSCRMPAVNKQHIQALEYLCSISSEEVDWSHIEKQEPAACVLELIQSLRRIGRYFGLVTIVHMCELREQQLLALYQQ
jgi:hypothetical protein